MRIALVTDFGTRDPYVAEVKGVIASRTAAEVVDLTHEIEPFDVFAAGWFLHAVVPYWPRDTIFVAVVDPGVGTARRIIAAEEEGRHFLAPDNGLLSLVLGEASRIVSVEDESLFLPGGSSTFHGRDRFAPVAAALAEGTPLEKLGPAVAGIVRWPYEAPSYGEIVRGSIVSADRFGNLITDIEAWRIPFHPFALHIHGLILDRLENNYGDAAPGLFLIVGSSGLIEVSAANASAKERLGLGRHERIEIHRVERRS